MRKLIPLTAGFEHIEKPIQHFARSDRARSASGFGRWDQRFQNRPFGIGEVTRIRFSVHPSSLVTHSPLFKWPLRFRVPLQNQRFDQDKE
jgi:hypothetical protein